MPTDDDDAVAVKKKKTKRASDGPNYTTLQLEGSETVRRWALPAGLSVVSLVLFIGAALLLRQHQDASSSSDDPATLAPPDPCGVVSCPLGTLLGGDSGGDGDGAESTPLPGACCAQAATFLGASAIGAAGASVTTPEFNFTEESAGYLCHGSCYRALFFRLGCFKDEYGDGYDSTKVNPHEGLCKTLQDGCFDMCACEPFDDDGDKCPIFVDCPALGTSSRSVQWECCRDATDRAAAGGVGEGGYVGRHMCGGTCFQEAAADENEAMLGLSQDCEPEGGGDEDDPVVATVTWSGKEDVGRQYWVDCAAVKGGLPVPVEGYSTGMSRRCCETLTQYVTVAEQQVRDGEWCEGAMQVLSNDVYGEHLCSGQCFEQAKEALGPWMQPYLLNNLCAEAQPKYGIEVMEEDDNDVY